MVKTVNPLTDHEAETVSGTSGSHISQSSTEKREQKGYKHLYTYIFDLLQGTGLHIRGTG